MKRHARMLAIGFGAGAIGFVAANPSARAWSEPPAPKTPEPPKPEAKDPKPLDRILFRSGKVIDGEVIEETATTVRIKVVTSVGLVSETTYDSSEILKIERGAGGVREEKPAAKPATPASSPRDKKAKETSGVVNSSESDATKVYLINLKHEFGRDVSATPLKDVMADAKKQQPGIIVIKLDCEYKYMGEELPDFVPNDAGPAFNQLETARQLSTMFTDDIRDDQDWTIKPRVVMWVRKALGGAAFLPFAAPDIYYTSDALHGGVGGLETIFNGVGDKVAQEKQYSLRLKRAEGLAIKGGHEPKLVRAMARTDYVLSVSFEGGQPVYHEDASGDVLLTDDGKDPNKDTEQAVVRFQGNDTLTLNADMAYKLGLSKGTVDTLDQLLFELGVSKNASMVQAKQDKILEDWGKDVTQAERDFRRLWRQHNETQVQGTWDERSRARGKRIQILKQIKALLERFKEAINPRAIEGAPNDWTTQINIMIDRLEQEQRRDKK
ncbi:MAG: hypothetical protein JNM07_10590 [Phycisphaerae bacterium]|nr:hypothetical protein [Phycisphaerae bacterium]